MVFGKLEDISAMLRVKYQFVNNNVSLRPDQTDLKWCYDILCDVSRSFAAVIIQLHPELRDAVCIFYLVLRGLDTVEDDMTVPLDVKLRELPKFHEKLQLADWHIDGIGKDKERELLESFWRVSLEHQKLKPVYQVVISDICERMANGMCHFLQNEVVTKSDYDLYCHYVAGLVGHGLTRLFASSGLEAAHIQDDLRTANSMGLFLQKTNIIRDYFEDIREEPIPRMFWPRQIWGNFATSLDAFKEVSYAKKSVECLNAMVTDALQHLPDCVAYMKQLSDPTVVLFCGIPQVMAIATLAELYGNADVFQVKVKISKAATCKIILRSNNVDAVLEQFAHFMSVLESRLNEEDPSFEATKLALGVGWRCLNEARIGDATKTATQSYARGFLGSFRGLGGGALYNVVDNVSALLRSKKTPSAVAATAQ